MSKFEISKFQSFRLQMVKFQIYNVQNCQLSKLIFQSFKKLGTQTFKKKQNSIFSNMEIILFKDVPILFLYFWKYFGDKYGVRGSGFGHMFGRSENNPKNIAIERESLISHFGIIQIPPKPS